MIKKVLNTTPSLTSRLFSLNKPYFNRILTSSNYSHFSTSPKSTHETVGVAQTEELALQQLAAARAERIKELQTISDEKEFPSGAALAGALITAPLLLGSVSLNIFAASNLFVESLPMLFMSLIKYSGLHLTFMVKILKFWPIIIIS